MIKDIFNFTSKYYSGNKENFGMMADNILNNIVLCVMNKEYRICEIEFYHKNKKHNDLFVHCDERQMIPFGFYFHRQNGKGFKSGTFKGMDLTFKTKLKSYSGILIRSLYDIENDKLIEGSCKIMNEILKNVDINSVAELHKKLTDINNEIPFFDDNQSILFLKEVVMDHHDICASPRVGLTLKNDHKLKRKYIMKNYRFSIMSDKLKKYKSTIIISQYKKDKDIKMTKRIMQYIDEYNSGINMKYDSFVGKSLSVSDINKLYGLSNNKKI
jgi:hypothetical protein